MKKKTGTKAFIKISNVSNKTRRKIYTYDRLSAFENSISMVNRMLSLRNMHESLSLNVYPIHESFNEMSGIRSF